MTRAAVEAAIAGLDREAVAGARWFAAKGRTMWALEYEHAFVLDAAGGHVLAIVVARLDDGSTQRYTVALTGDPLREAVPGDGTWRALLVAAAEGRTIPALADEAQADGADRVTAALVCRPGTALASGFEGGVGGIPNAPERPLGRDQSNTSVVVGEAVVVKAYRRLEAGLNPELELVAFLTEVAGFGGVAPLAGYVEVVSERMGATTVAVAQSYVADGEDAYEAIAETLTGWLLAPGEVSVEFATEVAAELGELTASLHAALADPRGVAEFEPREARREELRDWAREGQRQLVRAVDVAPGEAGRLLRELAPRIAAELTVFEALASPPVLTRVHGDLHLGQVLASPGGYWIVDFEGEPNRPIAARRSHGSPLRDVACMLRSLDHVGRSALRRAETRAGGPLSSPGLDIEAWLRRARERFLEAYRLGLRRAGAPIDVDPDLVRAFEIEKETYEFVYASTYLPSWLWAPTEGMRGLFSDGGTP